MYKAPPKKDIRIPTAARVRFQDVLIFGHSLKNLYKWGFMDNCGRSTGHILRIQNPTAACVRSKPKQCILRSDKKSFGRFKKATPSKQGGNV